MERGSYRPPSYSDSFLRSPSSFQLELLAKPTAPESPPHQPQQQQQLPETIRTPWHQNALKFSFHIFLISVFETAFYFGYVSQYENTAIINLTQTYILELGQSCSNLTTNEQSLLNNLLKQLVNATQILEASQVATNSRLAANGLLLRYAVLYILTLFTIFGSLTIWSTCFQKPVKWREIFLENGIVLIFLAVYEYLFFRTVVIQYALTSAPEINGNLVRELQTSCGLLT